MKETDIAGSGLRGRAQRLVASTPFQRGVLIVIFVNAVTLGLETSPTIVGEYRSLLQATEFVVLTLFGVEMAIRLYAGGRDFFRDPWNWFDLIVVALAVVPFTHFVSVIRVLRVLRLARLVSAIPSLRRVTAALLSAVPGIGSIILLLAVALYSGGVLGVELFRDVAPDYFGSLDRSLFTMFEVMTLENWPDIAEPVIAERPYAWVFFVGYILVTAFILLNLLIGVIVSAMEIEVNRTRWREDQLMEERQHDEVMAELRELRAMVVELRGGRQTEPDDEGARLAR